LERQLVACQRIPGSRDPGGTRTTLQEETILAIADMVFESETWPKTSIMMEVEEGRAKLVHSYSPVEQIKNLSDEVDSLRVTLREIRSAAGFLEMTGKESSSRSMMPPMAIPPMPSSMKPMCGMW
jgi:hypothetical protein